MASVEMLIRGALANALTFTSYLFHRLSADNIDAERKRHDAAIEALQAAQLEWAHKRQQRIDFINNQLRLERKAETKFTELNDTIWVYINPPMPTTRAHKFCGTQPTTSLALLRIQLIIPPTIPGNASAALIPNRLNRDAKALSLFLIHSFKTFSSLGGGSPPPDAMAPPPPGNNASTSTPMAIGVSMEAIVIPCSLNRVWIFSANEVSLSKTLAIVSLKLVIWFFSLPLRRSIDSCLTFKSSLRSSIRLVISW